jgi:hypothetical protein
MITILSAVICLRAFCYETTIPTSISFEMDTCARYGRSIAQHLVSTHWTVESWSCKPGRAV